MKHSDRTAVPSGEDQTTDNDIDGDVSGTSIQAGSIGEFHLNPPRKPLSRKVYLAISAAAVVGALTPAAVVLMSPSPDEPVNQTPAAVASSAPAETGTPSSPVSSAGTPIRPAVPGVTRPVPGAPTPRPSGNATVVIPPPPPQPTTVRAAATPPPSGAGVRFSGALQFGSFHLDLAQPRDMPGMNVWRMPQNRLHGDDTYELAEWIGDGAPGQAECAADLVKRATRDAEHLIIGSRVCGKTPGGRIFLIEVVALDGTTITGQVTVWE
ncbi:hypothetical protein ACIA8G_08870 [Lentzea sp. NPDC051213]|uniref:hypothetical protein n=1 Tax=Lentzea sp. NPDC051213 TaxID=3364126 RepID=UPI0037A5AF88